ncbi:MAG: carbon-nitrogen hydrolase family protein [Chloroflexi bacterium]|nr:carbon-nitrogen hydrolase family protein [Chloroflexota bacterium]
MTQPDDPTLRVAAAQIAVNDDMEANLGRILDAMRRTASRGAEVVVFPETALTGYSPAIGHGREPSEWPAIREGLRRIAERARALDLWTVVGTEVWEEGAWWNREYVYSADGEEVATYDKMHLMDADTRYYSPGARDTLFEIKGITIGLQICYDARFPEGYRSLLHRGAQVILQGFYGAGGATWKVPVLAAHLRSRAAECGCFVVAANVSGPLQIVVSQIIDPLGLILAQANQDCEELIYADLDMARIQESEIRRDYLARFRAT